MRNRHRVRLRAEDPSSRWSSARAAPASQRGRLGDRVQRFSHPRDSSEKEPRNDTTFRGHLKDKIFSPCDELQN